MEKSNQQTETLNQLVERLADEYVRTINSPEKYKKLFKSAFKSGCYVLATEFAKSEVALMLEHHMKLDKEVKEIEENILKEKK